MTRTTPSVLVAALLALGLSHAPAQAQLSRTFVSAASGNDANNCDRPTPCRTFQGAHDKANSDGEITVLDPGGYGALTITKAISIVNDGVGEASILVSGGAIGILIQAPAAAAVNLRGITVQGIGFGGGTGLRFTSGRALTIENCVFRSHTGSGIEFVPNASSNLAVSNTLVSDNMLHGIAVQPTGTNVSLKIALTGVESYNNGNHGLLVSGASSTGTINATVTDSVAGQNGSNGFLAFSGNGQAAANILLVRSLTTGNITGVQGLDRGLVRMSQSTSTGNLVGWTGTVLTYGDNNIDGNFGANSAPFPIAKK